MSKLSRSQRHAEIVEDFLLKDTQRLPRTMPLVQDFAQLVLTLVVRVQNQKLGLTEVLIVGPYPQQSPSKHPSSDHYRRPFHIKVLLDFLNLLYDLCSTLYIKHS